MEERSGCCARKKSQKIPKMFENMKTEDEEKDWVKVLYEVILKILTLGFYHIAKNRKDK
ncbi:MAG: hypothetical protein IJP76_08110 [Paludibacteraceae bacterium]|nr:hypothetical protein [Paludibacteraceae bacterium]